MEKLFFEDNENEIMDRIYENFKKEPKRSSVVTEEKEVLEEGLKFFKVSKRLYKLSDKLIAKAKRNNNDPEVINTAKKISKLAQKFEDAEDLYDVGRKSEAKVKYKKLIKDYNDLLKILKKSEVVTALKGVGGLAVTVASMTLPYMLLNKFFPSLSFGAANKAALEADGLLAQAKIYLKRAGAFALCGIPTKAANSIFNNGITMYDDKITDEVDKLLS